MREIGVGLAWLQTGYHIYAAYWQHPTGWVGIAATAVFAWGTLGALSLYRQFKQSV